VLRTVRTLGMIKAGRMAENPETSGNSRKEHAFLIIIDRVCMRRRVTAVIAGMFLYRRSSEFIPYLSALVLMYLSLENSNVSGTPVILNYIVHGVLD
jgi:hypothetical protein